MRKGMILRQAVESSSQLYRRSEQACIRTSQGVHSQLRGANIDVEQGHRRVLDDLEDECTAAQEMRGVSVHTGSAFGRPGGTWVDAHHVFWRRQFDFRMSGERNLDG